MKRDYLVILSICCMSVLSACSLRDDAAESYKQENPLQVQLSMPEAISADEPIEVEAVLSGVDEKADKADFVHFEILKQDGSVRLPMEEANVMENGAYEMEFVLEEDGLYYLDVHAGKNGSIISPRRQFIVGELSDEDLEALKEGGVAEQEPSGKHH